MMKKITLVFTIITFALSSFGQTDYNAINNNMVVGDFDNDGFNDDIAAFYTHADLPELLIWTSNDGSFEEKNAQYNLPTNMISAESFNGKIVSGDFDNDGFIDDLAAIHEVGYNNTSITVWINNNGLFSPKQWWYGGDFDANQTSKTMVAGDFDQDGFVDDIAAFYDYEQKQTKVFVWKSDKEKFSWPGTWWIGNDFNSTRIQGTIVVGDFDHDGFNDDIAGLYNYIDDYCKIFVWTTNMNKFNWPYTWFAQENFAVSNSIGNVVSGDFNKNGYVDNIAALYGNNEVSSSILVWEKQNKGFNNPTNWWYGENEAIETNSRIVAINSNTNAFVDQITGLKIQNTQAQLQTWTADNKAFDLPSSSWEGVALAIEDCEKNGGCLPDELVNNLSIYPNPSNGAFALNIPEIGSNEVMVSVYNVLGSLVYQKNVVSNYSTSFDLSNLNKGNYLVKITTNDYSTQKKLIIE